MQTCTASPSYVLCKRDGFNSDHRLGSVKGEARRRPQPQFRPQRARPRDQSQTGVEAGDEMEIQVDAP